jgi:hypothetical protein
MPTLFVFVSSWSHWLNPTKVADVSKPKIVLVANITDANLKRVTTPCSCLSWCLVAPNKWPPEQTDVQGVNLLAPQCYRYVMFATIVDVTYGDWEVLFW